MKPIRVEMLKITEFRKFKNCEIRFLKRITFLAGQNGTAKSTVLGMLAQPFSFGSARRSTDVDGSTYVSTYHGLRLDDFLDISGKSYTYDCDKIFRLSKKFDTPDKKYLYETIISGVDYSVETDSHLKGKKLLTVRQPRSGGQLRFVTGPGKEDAITHNAGEGNFPHPVIYLSLGRLLPLAEVKDCCITSEVGRLSEEEQSLYVKAYKRIFSLVDENPASGLMEATGKSKSIVPIDTYYDGESCSAGQDNIGRILTALLSFRRLKDSLGEKYRGGLLLIDEIDATLHPASQYRLIEVVNDYAKELDLQVVVTTHSLFLIDSCCRSKLSKDIGIVHIRKFTAQLKVDSECSSEDLELELKNESMPPPKKTGPEKVSVLLEDSVAVSLLKFLTKKSEVLNHHLEIANISKKIGQRSSTASLSGNYLEILPNNAKKIPLLKKLVIVPDGDMGDEGKWASKTDNPNVLPLPGTRPIETQMYELLRKISDEDPFWGKCLGRNYAKPNAVGDDDLDLDDIDAIKKWFKRQVKYWGRGNAIAYERYYQEYRSICDAFLKKLEVIYKRCV